MRRSSPVQQWLDSLPAETEKDEKTENQPESSDEDVKLELSEENMPECSSNVENVKKEEVIQKDTLECEPTSSKPKAKGKLQRDNSIQSEACTPKMKNPLLRDYSLQSDASGSSGSSVLNVLGARKVDAESVLLALGFGPSERQQKLQRIPDRFLAPSKLKGISTDQFIKDEHHSMRMHDCGIFGYRGLTGNPHVPPSTIVAKIMKCILNDDVCREQALMKARHSVADIRSAAAAHGHIRDT